MIEEINNKQVTGIGIKCAFSVSYVTQLHVNHQWMDHRIDCATHKCQNNDNYKMGRNCTKHHICRHRTTITTRWDRHRGSNFTWMIPCCCFCLVGQHFQFHESSKCRIICATTGAILGSIFAWIRIGEWKRQQIKFILINPITNVNSLRNLNRSFF